ncbi:MAG: glycosyltransferase, partial [Nitrososphaerota archaeon]|nr:glycosyltransferase [Nitrososphaerota archaeon]
MEQSPQVAIVIVVYNGYKIGSVVEKSIRSALNMSYPNSTVTVVDNSSTDGTPRLLEKFTSEARVIRTPNNLGFAGGNNYAYERDKSEYVLLLNPDAVAEPDSLSNCMRAMKRDPRLGAAGGIQVSFNKKRITNAGGLLDTLGRSVPIGLGRLPNELRST